MERGTALILEDDAYLCRTLAEVLAARFDHVETADSLARFRELVALRTYAIMILDYKLPDGTGLDALDVLNRSAQFTCVIAISGDIGPEHTFELAQKGVRAFLKKPFGLSDVRTAVERALGEAPDLSLPLRSSLGKLPLRAVEATVRETMVSEALSRSGGNVSAAASLLGISRQLLNHIRRRVR
ncbi:MAG TPA: DNA-binding response regulator [Polyangiaceae bacterium]